MSVSYHEGNITMRNPERYNSHPINTASVTGGTNLYTATETSYTISFVNTNYIIPIGSEIIIQLPSELEFTEPNPSLTNKINLDLSATGSTSGNNLIIIGGFAITLIPDQNIAFTFGSVINPYYQGTTGSFSIKVYTGIGGNDNNRLFYKNSDLTVNINTIGQFPLFSVTPTTFVTNEVVNYNFAFKLGFADLNDSHIIEFEIASEVQDCVIGTLNAGNMEGTSSNSTPSIYQFEIATGFRVAGGTSQIYSFSCECRNPYTTKNIGNFHLRAKNSDNSVFYTGLDSIGNMCTQSDYNSFIISIRTIYPREINTFTIDIDTTSPLSTIYIDQIEIEMSPGLEILNHIPSATSGISGTLTYILNNQNITINGITVLDDTFSLTFHQIRNPNIHSENIYITVETKHSGGILGELGTQNIPNLDCDFPCKTCHSGYPTSCITCFSDNNEVFQFNNLNLFMLYNDMCLDICPSHTYNNNSNTCNDCDAQCNECEARTDNCTACYDAGVSSPHTPGFLHSNTCLLSCPIIGFTENYTTRVCDRNHKLYIYIYIYI